MFPEIILIKGAGDLASGTAHRLHQSGMKVVMTEQEKPTLVRRSVSFAQAAFDGYAQVEGITACRVESPEETLEVMGRGEIPLLINPELDCLTWLPFQVLVEGTVSKRNTGVSMGSAPVVIALGPGYHAGRDVHAVVETSRGHNLGKVIYQGEAFENTGIPGEIGGYTVERLLRAPVEGHFETKCKIGNRVQMGEEVARVNGVSIKASISGIVRGLLYPGLTVFPGMKVGDIDPRGKRDYCFTISDKARSVAGGVLEAILCLTCGVQRNKLTSKVLG